MWGILQIYIFYLPNDKTKNDRVGLDGEKNGASLPNVRSGNLF